MRAAKVTVSLAMTLFGAPAFAQPGTAVPATVSQAGPQAGTSAAAPASPVVTPPVRDAADVRRELSQLLGQYPPALRDVLRLSPGLAANAEYLQPYPALAGFLAAHPEVHQNPAYYFGTGRPSHDDAPGAQRARAVADMMDELAVFGGLMALLAAILWFSRSLLDHQRWKRAIRVQAEAHAKLVERLSSPEDVLAYAQSPAGRQFLESGAPMDGTQPAVAAPVGRILWSVQVGTVVATLGLGLFVCARMFAADPDLVDVAAFLRMVATVGLAVGVGFLASAALSYVLSQRLGLLARPEAQHG